MTWEGKTAPDGAQYLNGSDKCDWGQGWFAHLVQVSNMNIWRDVIESKPSFAWMPMSPSEMLVLIWLLMLQCNETILKVCAEWYWSLRFL